MKANFGHIRERLQQRRRELLIRHARLEHDLRHVEMALSPDFSEQAVEMQNDETLRAIDRATTQEIAEIDAAMQRLDEGEYGLCKQCGRPIAPHRLAAMPQSVTCTACR